PPPRPPPPRRPPPARALAASARSHLLRRERLEDRREHHHRADDPKGECDPEPPSKVELLGPPRYPQDDPRREEAHGAKDRLARERSDPAPELHRFGPVVDRDARLREEREQAEHEDADPRGHHRG